MLYRFDTMTGRSVPAGIRFGHALYMTPRQVRHVPRPGHQHGPAATKAEERAEEYRRYPVLSRLRRRAREGA